MSYEENNTVRPEEDAQPRPVQRFDSDDGQQSLWCEPVYEDDAGDVYTPGRFAYGPQRQTEENRSDDGTAPPKQRSRSSSGSVWRFICLALIIAVVAGSAGWLGVELHLRKIQINPVSVHMVQAGPHDASNAVPGYTGEPLTGTEIYYGLATSQVVGVNTSLTTNVFGQTSETAVSGSGFILSEDGYILTNYHVVAYAALYDGDLTVLTYDGTSHPAKIVGYVEDNDLAVIKIEATGLTPVVVGDSDAMRVGETVYAVGNPLGELTYTMTGGFVSALDRVITTRDSITGKSVSMNMFQLDAAVNSGNSGGPVYNVRGEVIGIVTAKSGEDGVEGLGFAIPMNDALALATQLIERGYVSGAQLGVNAANTYEVYSKFIQEYYGYPDGACVTNVVKGSAAEKAGIQAGDIIVAVDGRSVSSTNELKLALRHYNPGDTAEITVHRVGRALGEGSTLRLTVTFDAQVPEAPAEPQSSSNAGSGSGWWDGFGK